MNEENIIIDSEDVFDDVETDYESEQSDGASEMIIRPYINFPAFIYRNISIFGLQTKRYLKRIFGKIFGLIKEPFVRFFRIIAAIFLASGKLIKYFFSKLSSEEADFKRDYKDALSVLKNNKKSDSRKNPFKLLFSFSGKALKKHREFFVHTLSYVLPAIALIVFIITVNYFGNLNFALKVTYNNSDIGYIESEKVFSEAKDILEQRLEIGGQSYSSDIVSEPEYKISVVKPNEISDSSEICEKIIENSDAGLITACGVYVDDKFIASVRNESDASSVFKSMISDYCSQNGIDRNSSDSLVDIVENISYVQGLYSEKTLMDSVSLKNYLSQKTKSESSKITVSNGDTASSLSSSYSLTLDQFMALNPQIDSSDTPLKADTKVNIIKSVPFVNVSISKTEQVKKELKYNTIEIPTDSLYQGVKKKISDGKNGEELVTNLITYLNGQKISTKTISRSTVIPAVAEQVYVGTRPIPHYVTLYGVTPGTFIWPAVGVNQITSPFGYRNLFGYTKLHQGIDISGGGALGKPVIASAAGTVESARYNTSGYGCCIIIDHGNGLKTRYAHLLENSFMVSPGDVVAQGQIIALLGNTGNSTGPHLHFEIIYNGSVTDPLKYLTR